MPHPGPTNLVHPLSFRRAPLGAAAVWLALGIGLARFVYQPILVLTVALVLLSSLAILAILKAPAVALLPVAAIWITTGMAASEWQPSPTSSTSLIPFADGLGRRVEARIVRLRPLPPRPPSADADQVAPWDASELTPDDTGHVLSADLALTSIEQVTPDVATMVPISGTVRVTLYAEPQQSVILHCGQPVEAALRLKPLQRYRDPGAWQYADYLAGQGITAHASAAMADIHPLGSATPTVHCRLQEAQAWAAERLLHLADSSQNRNLPALLRLTPTDAGMLNAMLFGDRSGLAHTLRLDFERTGSFHLFVVSGLHIALVAAGVFWLLSLVRVGQTLNTLLTVALTTLYAALTGFGQPAQRSLVMVSVFLLARLLSRERDSLNALGAAALVLLLWSPSSLFEASLQMTLLAVVAIAGLAHPIAQRTLLPYAYAARQTFEPRRGPLSPSLAQVRLTLELLGDSLAQAAAFRPLARLPSGGVRTTIWLLELALIGVVVELVMVLPMASFFHRAVVLALPANMLILPLLGILVPAATATFVGSVVSPLLALAPCALTSFLLHTVTTSIFRLSHLSSADVRVPPPTPLIAVLAVAAWIACCWAVRRNRFGAMIAFLALPLIAALVLWPRLPALTPNTLEITALDVGQGDSLLAVSPEGRTMLIDAGGPIGQHGVSEVVSAFDLGEQVVSPYLWTRRIRHLDVVVLTHAHTDHMGGLPAILQNFHPNELWVGVDPHSSLYAALLAQATSVGITVRHLHAGDHVQWGSVPIEVLSPAATYINPGSPKNDDSLVLHLQYGQASALLSGDAERSSERAMISAGRVHPVTLLKIGHHGSNTSTTPDFLAAAAPLDAILSSGSGNPFGHPRAEVISRVAAQHIHLFRTDELGLTTFLLCSDGQIREIVDSFTLPAHSDRSTLETRLVSPQRSSSSPCPAPSSS